MSAEDDDPDDGGDRDAGSGRHGTASDGDGDRAEGPENADGDRGTSLLEETFEPTPNEPDPPSFDVTSGEDLVNRLPDDGDVPDEVRKSFWGMVVLLKVALLALSLGAMFAYFRGQFAIAAGLGFLGVFAGVRLYLRIRAFGED